MRTRSQASAVRAETGSSEPMRAESPWTSARSATWLLLGLALGLLMAFHPTLLSGFARAQGDLGDPVFNQVLLEHHWQWAFGEGAGFWDLPMGYPLPGALAGSDVMLSFAPPYWLGRALGYEPETSFQFFMLAMASANYLAMWLLLRRRIAFDALASSFGAFVFAFGSARIGQLGHIQLLPMFFVLGAFASVLVFFENPTPERSAPDVATRRQRLAVASFASCLCAQFWGGFYMGYFSLLGAGVALAFALARKTHRQVVSPRLRRNAGAILVAGIASFAALLPLALRYSAAQATSLKVGVGAGESRLPRLASYLYSGPDSWLYGGLDALRPFADLPAAHEQAIGLGLATTAVLIHTTWQLRRRRAVRIGVAVFALLFLALTWFPFEIRLWRLWYYTVPGLGAIRAVARIGLLLSIPAALALAHWVHHRGRGGMAALILAVALFCCIEQGITPTSYDKRRRICEVEALAARVDGEAEAFYLLDSGSARDNLDALVVQQRSGIPTVNYYSGRTPREWTLFRFQVEPPRDAGAIRIELDAYLRRHRIDPENVQTLERPKQVDCPSIRDREPA